MSQQEQEQLFSGMLEESGMPLTEERIRAAWNATMSGQDCKISSNSAWSPFWRLLSAIATQPVLWLAKLLVRHALPNIFARYAYGVWLDAHAWAVDLQRREAEYAEGEITFSRAGASTQGDIAVPAGTVLESSSIAGRVYRLLTPEDAIIPDGTASARIRVKAEEPGAAYNLGPNYYSVLPKSISGVSGAVNDEDWLLTPGLDRQSDEELRLAIRNQFAAVGQYHHDAAYRVIISKFSGIRLDYLFFEKEAPRGAGSANCHIMIESGVPAQELIDSINQHVRESGEHGHGDDMLCRAIRVLPLRLKAVVHAQENASAAAMAALLEEAGNMIRCAFRENQDYPLTRVMPWSRFSISRLHDEMHSLLPGLKSIEISHDQGCGDIVSGLELPQLAELELLDGAGNSTVYSFGPEDV